MESLWTRDRSEGLRQLFLKFFKDIGCYVFSTSECKVQRQAVAACLKDELRTLRLEVAKRNTELIRWLAAIAYDHRSVHPGLLRCILAMRGLQTDLGLLAFQVCRYPDNQYAWCTLSNLLVPVLEEVKKELEQLDSNQWNGPMEGPYHPLLDNFLLRYSEEIEKHFLRCEHYVQFELRMMELLLLCPCGNLQIEVREVGQRKRVNLYCELRNTPGVVQLPKISNEKSKIENQQELLRFLILYIKRATLSCIEELLVKIKNYGKRIDDLAFSPDFNEVVSFVSAGDECSFEETKKNLGSRENGEVFKIFSSTNSGNYIICYSFELVDIGFKLFTASLCSSKPAHSISQDNCVKFSRSTKINYFTIEIKGVQENSYFIEKIIIQYKQDEDNYTLVREEDHIF